MNRSVVLAVLVPVLSMGVACGGDSSDSAVTVAEGESFDTLASDPAGSVATPETTAVSPPGDVATTTPLSAVNTPEAVRAAIDAGSSAAAWYPRLTGISVGTGLGAPIWFVDIDATGIDADYTARNDVASAIATALTDVADVDTMNVVARWSDGQVASAGGTTTSGGQLADVVALPPAPTTPDEVSAWLATVFGPGGLVALGADETWYASLTSFGTQDYGYGPELALTTTLTAADVWQLTLLQAALQSTGMLIESAGITGADGYYLSLGGGSFGGTSEPGRTGYFYPAR
ncbi:MAG: hypothetical protein HY828_06335 [Actinobacteria bacterium]|nr:hypothetical protein [Actinomycetota bacterium]